MRFDEELFASSPLAEAIWNRASGDDGDGTFWGVVRLENGAIRALRSNEWAFRPYEAQRVFAEDMVKMANAHLGHGGAWVLFFTHPRPPTIIGLSMEAPFDRWYAIWLDHEGDPQFTIGCEDTFSEVVRAGPDKWLTDFEEGWHRAKEMNRWVDPQPHQVYRPALGERKPLPRPFSAR